jgi:signal transduction histidine kinase
MCVAGRRLRRAGVTRAAVALPMNRLRRFLVAGLVAASALAGGARADEAGAAPTDGSGVAREPAALTTVAETFARWPQLESGGLPVALEGVVTSVMPNGAFRLDDYHRGIYVAKSAALPRVTAGERVRVSGMLRPGGFSPSVAPHAIERLGPAPFPTARPATFGALASGALDNQWVEIEGVVRAVDLPEPPEFAVLDLGMEGGSLRVLVSRAPQDPFTGLVDACVRIRGVVAANLNRQRQMLEPSFRVPSRAEISVVRAGAADPFAAPIVAASRVLQVAPGTPPFHQRAHIRGTVTRQLSAGTFFVRDDVGLKIETGTPVALQPGDRVEVAGFPAMKEGMAVLERALVRRVAGDAAPPPSTPRRLAPLLAGKHNSDLVRLRARLVDWVSAGRDVTLVFEAEDHLFKGFLRLPGKAAPALPPNNSLVEVTGICVVDELEDAWFYQPLSFVLLVAEPGDLALLEAPPWWTAARLWRALALACGILLAAAGWAWALRRQVQRSRALLEQQARHAATLEERNRIARELHDTLEQGLTGLSLQMKALETELEQSADAPRARLHAARQTLRQSRALARNAIRELRAESGPLPRENLAAGLRRIAGNWNDSGALAVAVQGDYRIPALPPRTVQHLLGIATEAMTNAVKHGQAGAIRVEVALARRTLTLRVADDGIGFDATGVWREPAGGFGLLGMRERASELGGHLEVASRPGQGTAVTITVPLSARASRLPVSDTVPPTVSDPAWGGAA